MPNRGKLVTGLGVGDNTILQKLSEKRARNSQPLQQKEGKLMSRNPGTKLTLRPAELVDTEILAELNEELVRDEGQPNALSREQMGQRFQQWFQENHHAVFFLREGEIMGYALYCYGMKATGEQFIFVRHFLVRAPFRRQGIGTEAMRMLLEEIWPRKMPVLLDVLVKNEAARAFWAKTGFQEMSLTLALCREKERGN